MKKWALFLISLVVASSALGGANPASAETYFFKISKTLRGIPPSMAERAEFENALHENRVDDFLQSKLQQYLKDDRFQVKLKQKMDELFLFQAKGLVATVGEGTSFDRLANSVLQNNQSWDQLLLGTSYRFKISSNDFGQPIDEEKFYGTALTGAIPAATFERFLDPKNAEVLYQFDFPVHDQRVAGVITTPRFFSRYVNTALNKNRRRAAAVFKIFLCDAMAPSVPPNDDNGEKQDFETIFPDHKNFTEEQIRANLKTDVHGEMPDCKACHYKLDPLGQTFGYSAATLAPFASPGALRYKGFDGRAVDIPLQGFGDLAMQLTQQPEYAQCQVRHFWNWYVGKDVPVSRAQQLSLVQKFNDLGRKPQDFVAYLLSLPEYREKPRALTEDQLLARRAVRILKNCNACHFVQTENLDMQNWDMTALPYGQTHVERARALKKMSKALDLDHDGAAKEMPPKDSLWKLSRDEFKLLKKWILKGAPDFDGVPQTVPEGPL